MLDFMEKSPLELMEMPSAHHQIMGNHQMGEILDAYPKEQLKQKQKQQQSPPPQQEERKMRPPPDLPRRCPRCDSANTKFCYYNNYSLTQPRYFCKACRRYWTQGGTLRNVPVGGGCRKNKRLSSSSRRKVTPPPRDQASITTTTNNSNQLYPNFPPQISYDPSDLTLAFAGLQSHDPFFLPNPNPNPNNVASYFPNGTGFLDILRTGFSDSTTTAATAGGRGFQNLYYGYGGNYYGYTGNSNVGEVESSTVSEEVVVPFEASLGVGETSSAAGEVSSCKVVDGGENKMLMGLPWQLSTGDGDYWNAAAPWHGLINSSLM